jgi:predicted HNH restriction endonuclease
MQERYQVDATKEDFIRAFSNESLFTVREIAQLSLHYSQPACEATPTFLGEMMGDSYQAASARNVAMAKKISRFLGISPPLREDGSSRWWAYLVFAEKDGRYWKLQLKPEVAAALKELGWREFAAVPEKKLSDDFQRLVSLSQAGLPEARRERLKAAEKRPEMIQVTRCEYRRNPDVVAEVLLRASGRCECCGVGAPFVRGSDGSPYLEVHHVVALSDGGDDTVENAMAACPNCHRRLHFG